MGMSWSTVALTVAMALAATGVITWAVLRSQNLAIEDVINDITTGGSTSGR